MCLSRDQGQALGAGASVPGLGKDAYLGEGAEILGASPEACVVIEDAPAGVQSAKAAGMRVVAVATTHRERELHEADVVVGALSEIRVLTQAGEGANGPTRLSLIAG